MAAGVLAMAAAVGCGSADKEDAQDTAGAMKMMDSTRDTATLNPTSPAPGDTMRRPDSVPTPTRP